MEKENEDLKTHLDRLKETLQRREFEWQTQFRDIQSTSQSIHEHHKELEMYLSEYDGQHEAIKALIKSSTPDLVHDMDLDDLPHPYPFLEYFSRFQTTYQSLQHSLNSVSHRFTESQKTVEKLERELETQSTLLDATSQDKAVLAKQYEQTLRNRDAALLQLDASQKAANTFKEKAEVLERKMKNIVQVYACQVALEIVPPRRS